MTENRLIHNISEQVLERLACRRELAKIAYNLIRKRNVEPGLFVQEKDEGGTCPNSSGSHLFICNKIYCNDNTFSCPPPHDTFKCPTETKAYNNCSGGDSSHQCNQTTSPTFSCNEGGKTADYFDCRTFVCGLEGGNVESFNCNSTVDFICGGEKYECAEHFDCTAGHGFACTNNHECGGKSSKDQFTCSGGEVKGCTEDGKVQAVSCTEGPKVNAYSFSSGGDLNGLPGDFLCGVPGGVTDNFDCTTDFDCKAESDFSCLDTSDFTCNDFKCHSKSPFMCYTGVTCRSSEAFDCSKKDGVTYNCAHTIASYAECKSDSEKECKSDYRCPSSNECTAPKFECSKESNMYKCVDSAPAYIPPDTFGA